MSGISRVSKFVRELAGSESLNDADLLRQQPFGFLVTTTNNKSLPLLIRPAVALALRCFTGDVYLAAAEGIDAKIAEYYANMECALYGTSARLRICSRESLESLPLKMTLGPPVEGALSVDATDDMAGVNWSFDAARESSAEAAAFAVASGFAKVFGSTILKKAEHETESWCMSLATFRQVLSGNEPRRSQVPVDLGHVLLVGAGAIGSAFAYILHLSSDQAVLEIVDKDRYDEPNQETTFFLSHQEACRRQPKAQVLAASTRRPGLIVNGLPAEAVGSDSDTLKIPTQFLVCAVDNAETRRVLDRNSSRWLLNGGLGGTAADAGWVLATRHGRQDASLSSLYAHTPPVQDEPPARPVDCSRIAYDQVTFAAPFLSLACGALLVACCRQITAGFVPQENYIKFDLLGKQSRYTLKKRPGPSYAATETK